VFDCLVNNEYDEQLARINVQETAFVEWEKRADIELEVLQL